jgi:uncharacterized tellurite resistance protein B-like protein
MTPNYELALLFLIHLLIDADGVQDKKELDAFRKIKEHEKISDSALSEFEKTKLRLSEKDIYILGMELVSQCTLDEKIRIFSILRKLSEVDGNVHSKEIRLLLYSLHDAGVPYSDILIYNTNLPAL